MTFGERLRQAIAESGQSIRALSRELEGRKVSGASYPAVDRYLKGKGEPDITWIREAATILGFNVEWLVAGTGEPRPTPAAPDPWEHITPGWLKDSVLQAAFQRVVRRGLNWLDSRGRRAERPDLFNDLERALVEPMALFLVERTDLPPGQLEHAVLLQLLALDAAIPLTAFDRLVSISGPEFTTITLPKAKPKTTRRPKRRHTRTEKPR